MAINDYLNIAASNLRRAAEERLREAEQKRSEFKQWEQQVQHQITDLKEGVRQKGVRVASPNIANPTRSLLLKEAKDEENEIKRLENAIANKRIKLDEDIRYIEATVNDLKNQATQITSPATRP